MRPSARLSASASRAYHSHGHAQAICFRRTRHVVQVCPNRVRPLSSDANTNLKPCEGGVLDSSYVSHPSNYQKVSSTSQTQNLPPRLLTSLPLTCPGCGALSQESNASSAGFYSRSRKAVKLFLSNQNQGKKVANIQTQLSENGAGTDTVARGKQENLHNDEDVVEALAENQRSFPFPICDRCHDLLYNSKGQSIAHPSIENLADSIAESPFKKNHVYHVLDAADFPMSLFPKVFDSLQLAKPRGRNRRSRIGYSTKPTVSFIITRADLLGPSKEIVDRMLPYFQSVLRQALERKVKDMRLGNVHLVSAKRGWWTKDIKDAIWARGGGNWMVGRVNVGKSSLFEVLFPKGSGDRAPVYAELEEQNEKAEAAKKQKRDFFDGNDVHAYLSEDSLLPPPQPEVAFPRMPIVSDLPGTTASPIRLPFGGHKGELIDLPGLERGDLEQYVRPGHRSDLVMQHRPKVRQHIIKPGQSLLLGGGLIRITPDLDPNDPSTTMLAYPFVPINVHVTSTAKALGIQSQQRESGVKSILSDESGELMTSAGMIHLDTDVTKSRSGPLLRAGVSASRLPFQIYSTDVLIEGVGWVELVCQVRRGKSPRQSSGQGVPNNDHGEVTLNVGEAWNEGGGSFKPFAAPKTALGETTSPTAVDFSTPRVEVFSPRGKYVGQRKPLGAWLAWEEGQRQRTRGASVVARSRKPMAGAKRRTKIAEKAKIEATGISLTNLSLN